MSGEKMRAGTSASEVAVEARRIEYRRRAIIAVMDQKQMRAAEWARLAGLPNANPLYNFLNRHSNSLAQGTLEKLAKAVNVSVAELVGERQAMQKRADVVPVRVEAASGMWHDSYDAGGRVSGTLPIPPGIKVDEAAIITDGHASLLYRPGTIIGIQSIASMVGRGLMNGDRVLLHRVRGGKNEVTVRQVVEDGRPGHRTAELVFISSDKRYGAKVDVPPWPYEGQFWDIEGDRLQIRGRVMMALVMDDA